MPSILAIKPKEKYFNILFRLYYVQLLNVFCMKRTIIYLLQLVTVFRSMGFYDIKIYGDQSYFRTKDKHFRSILFFVSFLNIV